MKIVLEKGQQLYFTSDTHYSHTNICRGISKWKDDNVTRDFKTLEHMNQTLVNNINKKVGENDILIHLGDWSFGGYEKIEEFRNKIVCKNIHLILGNHDHHIRNNRDDIQELFNSVNDYLQLEVKLPLTNKSIPAKRYSFMLMHFPIASWENMNKGVVHLHGHVHLPSHLRVAEGKAMDVGVDGNNLEPISLDEVMSIMKGREVKRLSLPKDHHEREL